MNRRGFFGAIAAAIGCGRAPVWKRDPDRCAWHDAAGGVITDHQLADAKELFVPRDVLTAAQLANPHLAARAFIESNPSGADGFMRRTYTESQYSRSIRFG